MPRTFADLATIETPTADLRPIADHPPRYVAARHDGAIVGLILFTRPADGSERWACYYPADGGDPVGCHSCAASAAAHLSRVHDAHMLLDVTIPTNLRLGRVLP